MESRIKKKILYVITKSNFGGAQRYVFELATSLPANAYEVAVACGGTGILAEKLRIAGIPIFEIKSFQRDINVKKEIQAIFELKNVIQTFKPDIVHLNSSKAGGIGALISRILGVKKIIFTAHGWAFWEDRSVLWRSLVWLFSWITALLTHAVIVVSTYEYTRTPLPFVKKKLVMIHTAVPSIVFKERAAARSVLFPETVLKEHEKDIFVVSTSEHNHNKNLLMLIEAIEKLNGSNTPKLFLVLMSDGEERAALETYVREHGLTQSVYFTGYVDDARTYLKGFDIFVLPSRKEGMPYGLLEAGSARLPVIASHVGGIPEIIEHKKNGLLINPKNKESLVNALQSLTTSPEIAHKYADSLTDTIATQFSLLSMIEKTTELYKK